MSSIYLPKHCRFALDFHIKKNIHITISPIHHNIIQITEEPLIESDSNDLYFIDTAYLRSNIAVQQRRTKNFETKLSI